MKENVLIGTKSFQFGDKTTVRGEIGLWWKQSDCNGVKRIVMGRERL